MEKEYSLYNCENAENCGWSLINMDRIELELFDVHKTRSITIASLIAFSVIAPFTQLLKHDTNMVASYHVIPYFMSC